MPTYGYFCELCHHKLEAFQKISDEPLLTCPQCGKESLKREIGGGSATFCFKGSGFYINDYKNPSSSSDPSENCRCNNTNHKK